MTIKKQETVYQQVTIIYLRDGGIISINIQDNQSENKKSYILNTFDNFFTYEADKPLEIKTFNLQSLNRFFREQKINHSI